jgi:hypothetical protein
MAVLAVSDGDGELEYAIETIQRTGWCPVCGAQARQHDRRPTVGARFTRRRWAGDVGVDQADLTLCASRM